MNGDVLKVTSQIIFVVFGDFVSILISTALSYLILFSDNIDVVGRILVLAFLLPILVSVPLLCWVCYLREKTGSLRHQSNYFATHDWLTGLPNGDAFSSLVERKGEAEPD